MRATWSRGLHLHPGQWTAACTAVSLIALFAMAGPLRPEGKAALALGAGLSLLLLPGGMSFALIPLGGLALLTPQPLPAVHLFDVCAIVLTVLAMFWTLRATDRRAWDLHGPGLFALAFVLTPLPALPFAVVNRISFLGMYKGYVLLACLFLSLRRLVPRARSRVLLWVFPIVGTAGALQLLWKTRGLGALLFARLNFRNFYSGLGWGQSDYISAVIECCLCGTIVLLMLERRAVVRVALVGALLIMAQAFLLLFSRAGALSLLVFAGILALSWKRERVVLAGVAIATILAGALATSGGQVFMRRFVDPGEYGSWYFRLLTWEAGIGRFLEHPWTGFGLNQGRYVSDVIGHESANSSILDFMGEQGILGGVLFVAIVVAAIRLAMRADPAEPSAQSSLRGALLGMVAAVVLHSLVEPTLTGHVLSVLFIYLLAYLTLLDPRGQHDLISPQVRAINR